MSITTKIGDDGTTRLFSGETVGKSSERPDAYGDIDELVSVLSVARNSCKQPENKTEILALQESLFVAGAEVATSDVGRPDLPGVIDSDSVIALEEKMRRLESSITLPKTFIIPGSDAAAAYLHHARCIARRCERKIVSLHDNGLVSNSNLIIWMNRLSDYLYLLALTEEVEFLAIKGGKLVQPD